MLAVINHLDNWKNSLLECIYENSSIIVLGILLITCTWIYFRWKRSQEWKRLNFDDLVVCKSGIVGRTLEYKNRKYDRRLIIESGEMELQIAGTAVKKILPKAVDSDQHLSSGLLPDDWVSAFQDTKSLLSS